MHKIVPLLNDEKVGMVTCLYRASKAPTIPAVLEAIGITSEFQPGVLTAWAVEGLRFALGATMATTRGTLESIGGFPAIADYLADDYMLGNLVWKAGYQVRLSDTIVETTPPLQFHRHDEASDPPGARYPGPSSRELPRSGDDPWNGTGLSQRFGLSRFMVKFEFASVDPVHPSGHSLADWSLSTRR